MLPRGMNEKELAIVLYLAAFIIIGSLIWVIIWAAG